MSDLEAKKLIVLERLANDQREDIFDRIIALLDSNRGQEESKVPDEHYNLLMEDREKYLRGELETQTWEEVKSKLTKKYGL